MQKYYYLMINWVYLFLTNICFDLIIFKKISALSIFYILIISILIASIIDLIISFIKKDKIKKIINIVLIFPLFFLFLAQLVHYYFYSCFFSFYSLTKSGQILDFFDYVMKIVGIHIIPVSILLILFIGLIILSLIKKHIETPKRKVHILLLILIPILFVITINIDNKGINSSYDLLTNTNNTTMNVQNFGLPMGFGIDFYRYFFNLEQEIKITKNNTKYEKGLYNIQDLNFNKKTSDESIKSLNNYFKNRKPTEKNEYTGIFKDKNLIFITAESFDFNIIDKELTPTLYKLREEGIYFTNHYTPIYYASTSDGEYTNLTGNLPKEGIWSYIEAKDKYFPYSYANLLKPEGYKTYSYHNGIYDFYDRYKIQETFGYDKFKACGKDLSINCNLWPQSDKEMINKTFEDYKNDEKFVSYYMTISGHLTHNFKTNDMAKRHKNMIKDLPYSKTVKAYISANIEFDKALESLINNLKKENKLDDTVIVIVPDHYPYGLQKKELKEIQAINKNYEIHKTGLLIYNSKIKPIIVDKLSSNIDILPTLLNMYGENYDSRIIIGKDIMDSGEKIVMFNDQSFLIEEGFYDQKKNKFEGKIKKEKLNKLKKEVNNNFNASNILIDKNYYYYLLHK